jgi:hypothetical protein
MSAKSNAEFTHLSVRPLYLSELRIHLQVAEDALLIKVRACNTKHAGKAARAAQPAGATCYGCGGGLQATDISWMRERQKRTIEGETTR